MAGSLQHREIVNRGPYITLAQRLARTLRQLKCFKLGAHKRVMALKEQIRDYLLGKADNPELEKELLVREDLFEELLIQEDEIIDEYVRWQNSFLTTPDRISSLRFAQLLNRYLAERASA